MKFTGRIAAFSVVSVLTLSVAGAKADITVVSWGGAYTASQQKAYGDTWEGGNIHWESYNGGLGEVRA